MTQPLHSLIEEHGRIRRMLGRFEAQLALFEKAEAPDYEILGGSIAYCSEYLDCWHHAKEDALLELLRRRDPGKAARCAELEDQHKGLAELTRELVEIFDAVQRGALLVRQNLVHRANALLAAYRAHLEWEETHFFPAAEAALTAADWQAVSARFAAPDDPLAANPVDKRYSALFRAIADAAAAEAACAGG
ncbi:MAG: hemerythrin domain-containing protein [Rhodobiaceae bacterium]|nr:hemerythrin domain-containing protein [Rhodobiaceae bacterium]